MQRSCLMTKCQLQMVIGRWPFTLPACPADINCAPLEWVLRVLPFVLRLCQANNNNASGDPSLPAVSSVYSWTLQVPRSLSFQDVQCEVWSFFMVKWFAFLFFSFFVCLLFFSMPQAAGSPVVCRTLMTTRILSDTACWSWPGPGHAHAISTPFAPRQLQAFAF